MPSPRVLGAAIVGLAVGLAACARPPAGRAQRVPDPAPAAPAPSTAAAFEAEIARFAAADRAEPPAAGGIVFVGSSSIRLWPDLKRDFPGRPVLNRGFGGATLPDVIHFAPRVVLRYRPRQVVLYAGDNDLGAGRTPEQVAADYATFVGLVRREVPAARVTFIAIKPSPSRWALAGRVRAANALIASAVAADTLASFADVFTPMLGAGGRPRPELFEADSLHMTAAGYAVWRERLAPHLR
jgi:lysophospholipase L1-like esterase